MLLAVSFLVRTTSAYSHRLASGKGSKAPVFQIGNRRIGLLAKQIVVFMALYAILLRRIGGPASNAGLETVQIIDVAKVCARF